MGRRSNKGRQQQGKHKERQEGGAESLGASVLKPRLKTAISWYVLVDILLFILRTCFVFCVLVFGVWYDIIVSFV